MLIPRCTSFCTLVFSFANQLWIFYILSTFCIGSIFTRPFNIHFVIYEFLLLILLKHMSAGWLAVWLSGNTLVSINVVALRQTQLVQGWVTVCGQVRNQPTRPTQSFILTGSINRVPTCPVGVKAGRSPIGWQITLCDPIDKWHL